MGFREKWKSFISPFAGRIFLAYVIIIAKCVAVLYLPQISRELVDKGVMAKDVAALCYYALLNLGVFLAAEGCAVLKTVILVNVGENMSIGLRQKLQKSIVYSPLLKIREHETGDLISRVVGEVTKITDFYSKEIPDFFADASILILGVVVMGRIDLVCTAVTIASLFLIYISSKKLSPKIREVAKQGSVLTAKFTSLVEQIVNNVPLLKYTRGYGYVTGRFNGEVQDIKSNRYKQRKYDITLMGLFSIFFFLPTIFMPFWCGYKIIQGEMSVGTYFALNAYLFTLAAPVMSFIQTTVSFQQNDVYVQRHTEVLAKCEAPAQIPVALKKERVLASVAFKNVGFSYGEKRIFEDLSFTVKAGERVQIKGGNGSGKSTLINLLMGILKPSEGMILINDQELSRVDTENLMCLVPQGTYFFEDSVENNILLGRENLKERLEPLVGELNLPDIIAGEKVNLKTSLSGKGTNVSGGQAQKINVLRSLLIDAPLVIFDEVDTYLDQNTKEAIYTYVNNHKEKTFIFISHEAVGDVVMDQVIYL